MLRAQWFYVSSAIMFLAGFTPGAVGERGGPMPTTGSQVRHDGASVSGKTIFVLIGILAACFIAGMVVKIAKGKSAAK